MANFLDDEEKYMPIILVSTDGKAMANTIKTLTELAYEVGRIPALIVVTQTGILNARQVGLVMLKEYFRHNPRGFLIDGDIEVVSNDGILREYVLKADKEGVSFVGAYFTKQGITDVMTEFPKTINAEQYAELEDWADIKAAGLGFYYGEIPLDYTFRFDAKPDLSGGMGEDFHFFMDHPSFNTKLAKNIILGHVKAIRLVIPLRR